MYFLCSSFLGAHSDDSLDGLDLHMSPDLTPHYMRESLGPTPCLHDCQRCSPGSFDGAAPGKCSKKAHTRGPLVLRAVPTWLDLSHYVSVIAIVTDSMSGTLMPRTRESSSDGGYGPGQIYALHHVLSTRCFSHLSFRHNHQFPHK